MQGLELSRRFYFEAVRPILERDFPDLDHAAARVGWGSEVLGFDDGTSQDHAWGPRLQLFLRDLSAAPAIRQRLADTLPTEFAGFPTHFGPTDEPGVVKMTAVGSGPVEHLVEVGALEPDSIHTPAIYVQRIFQGKDYIKRIEKRTVRKAGSI